MLITYNFVLHNEKKYAYSVDTDRKKNLNEISTSDFPWVNLNIHRCSNCTLSKKTCKICPAAADIAHLIRDFSDKNSFEIVKVKVKDDFREYYKECDLQTGLNSLLGLVLATSGCPILSRLKYMAKSHLPFSSYEESFTRSISLYLLKEYFQNQESGKGDFELKNLEKFYEDLKIVNSHLHLRLLTTAKSDANVNAINAFFSLSSLIHISLSSTLEDIKFMFEN